MFIVSFASMSSKLRRSDMSMNILKLRMRHGSIHAAPMELCFVVILVSINMPPLTGFMFSLLSLTPMGFIPDRS